MRQLAIGLGFLYKDDKYLLQLREGDPRKGAAGLIGAFGGKLEAGETPSQAVIRGLHEETTLTPDADDLEYLGIIDVVSDHELEQVKVSASIFRITLSSSVLVAAKEGTLLSLSREEALERLNQLTPATRHCFLQLL